jgi:hypothetical protein
MQYLDLEKSEKTVCDVYVLCNVVQLFIKKYCMFIMFRSIWFIVKKIVHFLYQPCGGWAHDQNPIDGVASQCDDNREGKQWIEPTCQTVSLSNRHAPNISLIKVFPVSDTRSWTLRSSFYPCILSALVYTTVFWSGGASRQPPMALSFSCHAILKILLLLYT